MDLRGHRLTGAGAGQAVLVVGVGSPTIVNGQIDHWDTGIYSDRPGEIEIRPDRTVTVSGVTFSDNRLAIDASYTSNFLTSNTATNFRISTSRFERNQSAIAGLYTGFFNIRSSVFTKNESAVDIDTGGVKITESDFDGNESALKCAAAACTLASSSLKGNTFAVAAYMSAATLAGNVISGSTVAFSANLGTGLELTSNKFVANKTGVALMLSDATLTKNTFSRNSVGYTSSDQLGDYVATLDHNYFVYNRDGIYTSEAGTRLKSNRAFLNLRWGIYAPLATDLGGNVASANKRSPQCVGVAC